MKVLNPSSNIPLKALTLAVSMFMLAGCGNDEAKSSQPNQPNPPVDPNLPQKNKATVVGKVVDEDGKPLVGAVVNVNGKNTTTDAKGTASLTADASKDKTVILVKKDGYLTTAKNVLIAKDKTSTIEIKLFKDQVATSFEATKGITVENPAKTAMVQVPENAVTKADGSAYTGKVNIAMSYYSPEELSGVQAFAQPYTGIQTSGGNVGLRSVGVTEVKLTDDKGNPLQLDKTKPATLTFPANTVSDGADSIPLWHYDETKKIWIEEGKATKQADGSYKGTVTHFTLWNLDIPINIKKATLKGCFEDKDGNRLNNVYAEIRTTGWSNDGDTDDGTFEVQVPANQPLEILPHWGAKFAPIKIAPLSKGQTRDNTNDCYVVTPDTTDFVDELDNNIFVPPVVVDPNPNTPPVARNNSIEGIQAKQILGNVITDIDGRDSDADGDTLAVTQFTVDTDNNGSAESFTVSQTATIANVGTFKLNAQGTYEFTSTASFEGNVPTVTYTVSDNKGGTDSATLSIKVNKPVTPTPTPIGSKIIGYKLGVETKDLNGKNIINDVYKQTLYIENGITKLKYESIKGNKIPNLSTPNTNIKNFLLTDKGLFDVSVSFEKNVLVANAAYKYTKWSDTEIAYFSENDPELTATGTLKNKSIANQSIVITLDDNSLDNDILATIAKLPQAERQLGSNETCKVANQSTVSKPSINFTAFGTTKGTTTKAQFDSHVLNTYPSKLTGTWASIPWAATTQVVDDQQKASVLYNGNIIDYATYEPAGTFTYTNNKCSFYSKEQIDFVVASLKKAYPNL